MSVVFVGEMKVKKKERSKKLAHLLFPNVEEDTERKKTKEKCGHGTILKVMETIISMLFKESCV